MEIVQASSARWDALAELFARRGGSDARFCWCLYWRLRSKEFSESAPAANRERLRNLVEAGPAPGLVALDGGRAVGWVGIGPRRDFRRLEHSRVIPRAEDPAPWAVVCFVVSDDARGLGIAGRLLAAAVSHARATGAVAIEGYPIDPPAAGARIRDTSAYVGTRRMFEGAGFRMVAATSAVSGGMPRVVMRLDL